MYSMSLLIHTWFGLFASQRKTATPLPLENSYVNAPNWMETSLFSLQTRKMFFVIEKQIKRFSPKKTLQSFGVVQGLGKTAESLRPILIPLTQLRTP